MTNKKANIIAFDLDGTLLNDKKQVGLKDYNTLIDLEKKGALRIAATGRNLFSLNRILPPDFPMDYAVFSSGAGIYDWKSKKIINSIHITIDDIKKVLKVIAPYQLNFTIHLPIPENHHMLIYDQHANSTDLKNYTNFYKPYASPIDLNNLPYAATQLIVLLNSHANLFDAFSKKLIGLKTILTTSPVDNTSLWMEVFNKNVSKANGVKWLIKYLSINKPKIFAIGNDYNDLDLLNYSHFSHIVSNAPASIQKEFYVSVSNNEEALTESISHYDIVSANN
ncbi:MAG: HAD family phosphatase [Salinivirgaceae bacterium]|nr:HAD family phosphatase [Salinivirgaceae bacterium]